MPPPAADESRRHSPEAVAFVQLLFGALRNREIYPPGHRVLEVSAERLATALGPALAGKPALHIGIVGDKVILGEYPLSQGIAPSPAQLASLRERGVEKITFDAETNAQDVAILLDSLVAEAPVAEFLAAAAVDTIRVGRLTVAGGGVGRLSLAELYNELYRNAAFAVRDLLTVCRERGVVEPAAAQATVGEVVNQAEAGEGRLLDLTNLPRQEGEAFSHALNTCILAVALGRDLGLTTAQLRDLGTAALLHDIGKQQLSEAVRHGAGLDPEQRREYERHPVLGANLLRKLAGVGNLAARVALEHHMGYDSTGFPRRTQPRPLHLATHVVAIANAYDNLRTVGAAEGEMTCDQALRTMARAVRRAYEPTLLKRFVDLLGLYPRGTLVLLSDGTTGLVRETRPGYPLTPQVLVIFDDRGEPVAKPYVVDLYEVAVDPTPLTILESKDARLRGIDPVDYLS